MIDERHTEFPLDLSIRVDRDEDTRGVHAFLDRRTCIDRVIGTNYGRADYRTTDVGGPRKLEAGWPRYVDQAVPLSIAVELIPLSGAQREPGQQRDSKEFS